MPFQRGNKPLGRGSRKGRPNKATADLKDMILGALSDAGGRAYLVARAKDTPAAFLTLIGKVLPTTLAGTDDKTPIIKIVNYGDDKSAS